LLNSAGVENENWKIALNGKKLVFETQPNVLIFKLDLKRGWNSLLLRNLDCPLRADVNRFRGNADDRPLCVMFGGLVLTE